MTNWHPMATAPRDGRSILVCCADLLDSWKVVGFDDEGKDGFHWHADDCGLYHEQAFTHWMDLPPQPRTPAEQTKDSA